MDVCTAQLLPGLPHPEHAVCVRTRGRLLVLGLHPNRCGSLFIVISSQSKICQFLGREEILSNLGCNQIY